MSELKTTVIKALNVRRTSLIVAIETARCQRDPNGLIPAWLVEVANYERRIAELGGTFAAYQFPEANPRTAAPPEYKGL